MIKLMIKIFVAGTFDLFHIGHQWLLWQAVKYGDKMVVIVARDKTVTMIKKRSAIWDEQLRVGRIRNELLPNTDTELGNEVGDFLATLKQHNPDLIVCGYDQFLPKIIIDYSQQHNIEIKRLDPYFPKYFKSSKFR